MRVGIIGAGHIGGNIARRLALAGHQVTVSFARNQPALAALADEVAGTAGETSDAAAAEVVVLSVRLIAAVRAGRPIPPPPVY